MGDLQEVTKQLLTRCEELEGRLYDTERAAKQLHETLTEQIEENYRVKAELDAERASALQLRGTLEEKEDVIEALRSDLQVATEASGSAAVAAAAALSSAAEGAHAGDLTSRSGATTERGGRGAVRSSDMSVQTTHAEDYNEEMGKLMERIAELEEANKKLEAALEDEAFAKSPSEFHDPGTDTVVVGGNASPVPTLNIGKGVKLDGSTSNLATDRLLGKGLLSSRVPGEQPQLGLVAATPRVFLTNSTPRGIPVALVSQTPRMGAQGVNVAKLLADASIDAGALAKLREAITASNIDLMTTPRAFVPATSGATVTGAGGQPTKIPPLSLGKAPAAAKELAVPTTAQPSELTRALGMEAGITAAPPSTRTKKYKLPLNADGCPTCNLIHAAEAAFPRAKLADRRQYAGAGWIPDVCMRWAQDHAFVWTNEERMIMQRVIEKKPQLKLFPVSQFDGPIHIYKHSFLPNILISSWKPRYAVLHGVFLYIFPQHSPDAAVAAAIPIRNSTITHCTLDGKANCLVIESLGCASCVGDREDKFGIEKVIIALPSANATEKWTQKLVDAQRTCPHECSSVFSDVHMLRDLIEDLAESNYM